MGKHDLEKASIKAERSKWGNLIIEMQKQKGLKFIVSLCATPTKDSEISSTCLIHIMGNDR